MYGQSTSATDYRQMPHVIARREAARARLRRVLTPVVIVALLAFGIYERERRIAAEYRALPQAPVPPLQTEDDLAALTQRLDELEKLIDRHPYSPTGFIAARERVPLQREVDQLEAVTSEARRQMEATVGDENRMADSLRVRGLDCAHLNDMRGALEFFSQALEVSSEDWERRDQVARDAAAIRALIEQADAHAGTRDGAVAEEPSAEPTPERARAETGQEQGA